MSIWDESSRVEYHDSNLGCSVGFELPEIFESESRNVAVRRLVLFREI